MTNNTKKDLKFSRRQALGSVLVGGLAVGASACGGDIQTLDADTSASLITPLPMPQNLLVNRERATDVMKAANVDVIICSRPENIYYLTNYYPQLSKMGMEDTTYAILPLDINQPPILVVGQFEFYIAGTEGITARDVNVHLFTMPSDPELFANKLSIAEQLDAPGLPSFLPKQIDKHPQSDAAKSKREETLRLSHDMGATAETSFLKAVRDLPLGFKRVAVDDLAISEQVRRAGIAFDFVDGEQLLRRIRLQKSPAEIELMRYAANANAQAGLAAAKIARDGATFQDIRREFSRQCADRFLTPEFMVVDGVVPDNAPGEIKEGQAFLIDCVSHGQYYHGDYGRTVCVGEPTGEMKRATAAIAQVWDDLLPQLKPGMRYSDIGEIATKAFSKTNSEANLICSPHSVGLHHTDEPSVEGATAFAKDDLQLVEGMVLSVDLPIVDVGLGGSAHLEDLVLIRNDGATLLNDAGDRVIIV